MGFFEKIKEKFIKNNDSSKYLSGFNKTNSKIDATLKNVNGLTKDKQEVFMEELMVSLLEADVGYETSDKICDHFYNKIKNINYLNQRDLKYNLYEVIYEIYSREELPPLNFSQNGPTVFMMIGVNGSGKTTSSAKLAYKFKSKGLKVALVAADTFRAGAIEQLKEWGKRLEIDVVAGNDKEDPSSVLVKGCHYAKENNIDLIICDTAGRLQNKVNLMNELDKMYRVLNKEIPNAPHETLLVIDANTGQNGLSQAKLFNEVAKLSGIILTKMDGTSKGGIILGINDLIKVPVRYIGLGEGVEDLSDFYLELYLYSILGDLKQ